MFVSTQASQAVSAANYKPPISRTGYENVLPHRTSELYSKIAQQDGSVTKVTKDVLEITYKDGTKDTYPLGLAIGVASGELHRHTRVTDLVVGDKFKKGQVVGWDEQWFDRDAFCPGQVVWKSGYPARIALLEDQDVFEDSIAISTEFADLCRTPNLTPEKFAMDVNQSIRLRVKVGDQVDYDSILCEIEDSHIGFAEDDLSSLAGEVNRLGIKQIRSKHHGTVVRIEATYNAAEEEMSETVGSLIKTLDKDRKTRSVGEKNPITSGSVSTNMNVKKPMIGPGRVMFTVFVESMDASVEADKYVIGNQMKNTVGAIMKDVLKTEDGQVIDVKSSFKGLFNRMVLSLRDKMAVNETAIGLTKLAIKAYRGK